MSLRPEKYDSRKELLEQIEMQNESAQAFFIYLKKFIEVLQYYDVEHLSAEVNEYLEGAVEKRNGIVDDFANLKKRAEEENPIIVERDYQKAQNPIVEIMERIIEDTACLRLPKTLDKAIVSSINKTRTATLEDLEYARARFIDNELGQGGELVLN